MVRRRVQRVKAMIVVLNLWSVGNHEPNFAKTADNVLGRLGQREHFSKKPPATGRCEISWFLRQSSFHLQFTLALRQSRFQLDLEGINCLAHSWFFLFWQTSQLLHQGSEFALRTEIFDTRLLQCGKVS